MKRLVILAPNWLGDAVMALPAIADIRRALPAAVITVAARAPVAPLFALVPDVDGTLVLQRPPAVSAVGKWRAIGAELSGRQFDAAVLFPNSIYSALLVSRAGIPDRWGYRGGMRARLLTRAIERTRGVHQVQFYQQLVTALGFPNGSIEPRVVVPAAARDAAMQLLQKNGYQTGAPLVALAPGAAYGGAKRWPPRYFSELAQELAADGVQMVVLGSTADQATAEEVVRETRGGIYNLAGRTDLSTLAGVLYLCRGLVTNDSGAMHLGAAVGIGVTAVFGPTDDTATRPLGEAHRVLTHPVWCRPCMLRECPLDHRCMRGVTVATVLDAARRTL